MEALQPGNMAAESLRGMEKNLEVKGGGAYYLMDRIWTPKHGGFRDVVMTEAHNTRYSVHPGSDKMYLDLKKLYWWPNMKAEIATFVSKCLALRLRSSIRNRQDYYNNQRYRNGNGSGLLWTS